MTSYRCSAPQETWAGGGVEAGPWMEVADPDGGAAEAEVELRSSFRRGTSGSG